MDRSPQERVQELLSTEHGAKMVIDAFFGLLPEGEVLDGPGAQKASKVGNGDAVEVGGLS